MTAETGLASRRYRSWILGQDVKGCTIGKTDDMHLTLTGSAARCEVNFYDMGDGSEIVEMRIFRTGDGEQVFFLHFMMDDEARARELFEEMAEAFVELGTHKVRRVLLCCTCGITTSMFASRMNEVAKALALDYLFEAKPLDHALANGGDYVAVLMAPQVSYLRQKVIDAFPDTFVIELPGKVYGSYDAAAAVRLVSGAIDQDEPGVPETDEAGLHVTHNPDFAGRMLVVMVVLGTKQSRIGYRVYDGATVVLEGVTVKRLFDYRDVEDVFATVRLEGIDPCTLDAVGIAVPGLVHDGVVTLSSKGIVDYDLRAHIEKTYGVKVYVDNDANAAAVACYVAQDGYRTVMYHRQPVGSVTCGQGTVIDGRLVTGHHHLAGELFYLERYLIPEYLVEGVWTEEGNVQLVARFLMASICTVAPNAVYVNAHMVSDLELLKAELAKVMPVEHMPDLLRAPDFGESIYLGELALCNQRPRSGRRR